MNYNEVRNVCHDLLKWLAVRDVLMVAYQDHMPLRRVLKPSDRMVQQFAQEYIANDGGTP